MINRDPVLFTSCALNVCLVGAGLLYFSSLRHIDWEFPRASLQVQWSNSLPRTLIALSKFNWAQVESEDYRVYVANLRTIGCPEETVRDIILSDLDKLYAPKFAAIAQIDGNGAYWRRGRPLSNEALSRRRSLLDEKNAAIKELLGLDPGQVSRSGGPGLDQLFEFLPEAKRRALVDLEGKYWDLEQRIYATAAGVMTAEDRAALESLRRQKDDEMNSLMAPGERFEYDLRNSPLARTLQRTLDSFQPTEQEFRIIYQAQSALEDKLTSLSTATGGRVSDQNETQARQDFENALKAALGDRRYLEYQRSQDPEYQNVIRIAERFDLPRVVASQVFDLKQNLELESKQVSNNPLLPNEEKQASLQALRNEASSTIANLLGDKGYTIYRDQDAEWIETLGKR